MPIQTVEIRPATRAETDAIVELWVDLANDQRSYGSHLLAEDNRLRIRESIVQRILGETVLVASVDETIAGFVMFTVQQGRYRQDVTQGVIENIYVRPEHRRTGIGSGLLSRAEAQLHREGVERISLEVMADNEAARRFYRTYGYAPHRIELEKSVENDTL